MRRIGAKRFITISAISAISLVAAACGTNPVVHDLSASERPLPQSAARPPTGLFAPSITSASSTTTVAASVRSATDRAGSGDWEGQRWDLGLISDVDLAQGTIEFDREQIVDPNGTFQSGPTITSEPMIRRPSELKNENRDCAPSCSAPTSSCSVRRISPIAPPPRPQTGSPSLWLICWPSDRRTPRRR